MKKASLFFDIRVCSKVEICEILDRTLLGRRVASGSTGFMHAVEVCSHAGVEDLHTVVEVCSSMWVLKC